MRIKRLDAILLLLISLGAPFTVDADIVSFDVNITETQNCSIAGCSAYAPLNESFVVTSQVPSSLAGSPTGVTVTTLDEGMETQTSASNQVGGFGPMSTPFDASLQASFPQSGLSVSTTLYGQNTNVVYSTPGTNSDQQVAELQTLTGAQTETMDYQEQVALVFSQFGTLLPAVSPPTGAQMLSLLTSTPNLDSRESVEIDNFVDDLASNTYTETVYLGTFEATPVSLPASLPLMLSALGGVGALARGRRMAA
jgi:hypothetical protein